MVFLRMNSIPLSMSLIKVLNSVGHNTESWGMQLIAVFHLDIELLTITLRMQPPSEFLIHETVIRHIDISPI